MRTTIEALSRAQLHALGKTELHERMGSLLGDERNVAVDFLLHLDEFDQQRGWRLFKLNGLREYCLGELGLREGAAHRRIHAMFVMRRFPQVEPMLRDGRLCMSILTDLEPVLNLDNADRLFREASGKSTRYVQEEVVAKMKDRVADKNEVRELKESLTRMSAAVAEARQKEIEARGGSVEATTAALADEVAKAVDAQLDKMSFLQHQEQGNNRAKRVSRTQAEVTMTLPADDYERMKRLLDRLNLPNAAALFAHCMAKEEQRLDKKDGKLPVRGAKSTPADPSTLTGVELERAVKKRADYRCRNCGSTKEPELDHGESKARGGESTYENLDQLCGPCNREKARLELGDDFVDQKIFERKMAKARKEDAEFLPAPEVIVEDGPLPEEPPGFWDGWEQPDTVARATPPPDTPGP